MQKKTRKRLILVLGIILVLASGYLAYDLFFSGQAPEMDHTGEMKGKDDAQEVLYYTCGMHPSVRVSPEEYGKGKTKGPICGMDLVPVYADAGKEENVVTLNDRKTSLAGIETFRARKMPVFNEIRTVGVVAFDPALRTAEQEYLQALRTFRDISRSSFTGARERARRVMESARLKLELMGFTDEIIGELETSGEVHRSLILPDEYMWVYADIYDYESGRVAAGDKVDLFSRTDRSMDLKGVVRAVEPVMSDRTRTLKLKILVNNTERLLKPNMYLDVYLKNNAGERLVVPRTAVLDTGQRSVAFVDLGNDRYQLRKVQTGPPLTAVIDGVKRDVYSVTEGISKDELVVMKGNYLLDSQSQLGAAGEVYGGALEVDDEKEMPGGKHQH